MVSVTYGSVEDAARPTNRRALPALLVGAAGAMAVCGAIFLAGSIYQGRAVSLEGVEFLVPAQELAAAPWPFLRATALHLGDPSSKHLPEERYYETDGWPTQRDCPGAWCTTMPMRVYPDSREKFSGNKHLPMTWGPCNDAIQDC